MSKVIYTAIIGGYDTLVEPDYKPDGWDFICFSDRDLVSDTWKIKKSIPIYSDNTRTARKHKLLAHRFLPEYDISIWIDGNINVRGDVNELMNYLDDCNYATHDHSKNKLDPRDCIYDEAEAILYFGRRNTTECKNGNPIFKCDGECSNGKPFHHFKDNGKVIESQMNRYFTEGYPKNNGLVVQMSVLRRHNELDVIDSMESQWEELKYNSKREQLSFNYIAWKKKLKFKYINGDSRDNEYFLNIGKHTGKK